MKNGLYIISDKAFSTDSNEAVGVYKKIHSQINALNTITGNCSLINLINTSKGNKIFRKFKTIFSTKLFDSFLTDNCEYLYIRRIIPNTIPFLSYLKKMKKINKNIKIIYEIPTYPYDFEMKNNLKDKLFLVIDIINRKKLKKYVDYITTYSDDRTIFGINTINIVNGIDCSQISIAKSLKKEQSINLVTVAQFSFWHGYDRLLKGLKKYYSKSTSIKVKLYMVGDGPELPLYKKYVNDNGLSDYVIFTGLLSGEKLDSIFNISDIAINSLGCHRIKIYKGSFLKSREYMARGMPLIGSTRIDVIPENWDYIKYFPENDSDIDIEKIVLFYNDLSKKEPISDIRKNIREFAEKNCDMKAVMQKVVQYI